MENRKPSHSFPRSRPLLLSPGRGPSLRHETGWFGAALVLLAVTACSGGQTNAAATSTDSGQTSTVATTSDPSTGGGASSTSTGIGAGDTARCDAPGLVWKSANKTNYESFPAPDSEECVAYNGCTWAGQFFACAGTQTEQWVADHNIASVFPIAGLARHDLCIRSGAHTMVVTALDTCGDSDCDGCCTENRGTADALIDLEKYTNARWALPDGPIEWADLGLNPDPGCSE